MNGCEFKSYMSLKLGLHTNLQIYWFTAYLQSIDAVGKPYLKYVCKLSYILSAPMV